MCVLPKAPTSFFPQRTFGRSITEAAAAVGDAMMRSEAAEWKSLSRLQFDWQFGIKKPSCSGLEQPTGVLLSHHRSSTARKRAQKSTPSNSGGQEKNSASKAHARSSTWNKPMRTSARGVLVNDLWRRHAYPLYTHTYSGNLHPAEIWAPPKIGEKSAAMRYDAMHAAAAVKVK